MLAIALGDLPHFTTFLCLFSYTVTTNLVFSYESISWDIDNRQGFLAGSPIRAVSMTALLDSLKMIKKSEDEHVFKFFGSTFNARYFTRNDLIGQYRASSLANGFPFSHQG